MNKQYWVRIPKEQMPYVGDMLRYDDCFDVDDLGDEYVAHCLSFTPERWQSFGFVPKEPVSLPLYQQEYDKKARQARGFTCGVRFAQKFLELNPGTGQIVQSI